MNRHPDGYPVKLVRDLTKAALGGPGTTEYRQLPRYEHVKRLRQKLVEEAIEYALDPTVDELADVLEVVHALADVDLAAGLEPVLRAREARHRERGGFSRGVGMYVTHPWDGSER